MRRLEGTHKARRDMAAPFSMVAKCGAGIRCANGEPC